MARKTIEAKRSDANADHQILRLINKNHTPDNKRAGEVDDSMAILEVQRHGLGEWVQFSLEEVTTIGKRTASRTITFVITQEMANTVAKLITTGG